MRMAYTITAEGLRKTYSSHRVLDDVDLTVETGTVFSLLGPNGAGKTTLVKILSTLVRPDAGTAIVAGHDLRRDPEAVRGQISLTGQHAAVDEVLTARENLVMFARLRRLSRPAARRRADQLLEEFDLAEHRDRRVKNFSGGMRRRLDLALSLIDRPALLFLDEPTTGLDPRSREQVWHSVRALTDGGTTVFLTTQYLEEADRLADDIALLHDGRIAARGTAEQLKSRLGGETAHLEFAGDSELSHAHRILADRSTRIDSLGRTIEVRTDGSANQVGELLAALDQGGAPATRITLERPSLDDVFLALTNSAHIPKATR